MHSLLKSIAKKTLIAFMLLSFSIYASSFQLDSAMLHDNISAEINSIVNHTSIAMDSDHAVDQHCNNPSSQHCNNCSHCVAIALTQHFSAYETLYIANRGKILNTEKRIETLFKPPRNS
jgi:hypothetical protein